METKAVAHPRRRTVVLVLTIALLNLPAIAVATHVFTDVSDTSTHAGGIEYVADVGITAGCTPTEYCPEDALTRAQMGTFLHRASGNSATTPPSVNAASVSAGSIQTVTSQRSVTNSNFNSHTATCPPDTVVLGGGGFTSSTSWRLEDSRPSGDTSWQVLYRHATGVGDQTTTVYARCLTVGQ